MRKLFAVTLITFAASGCQTNVVSQSLGLIPDESSISSALQSDLNRADKSGNADARFNLAEAYEQGRGVSRNIEKAIYWYERAVADNDPVWSPLALKSLGLIYEDDKQRGTFDLVRAADAYSRCVSSYGDDDCLEDELRLSAYPNVYVAQNPLVFGPPSQRIAPAGLSQASSFQASGRIEEARSVLEWHARSGNSQAQHQLALLNVQQENGRVSSETAGWVYLAAKGGVPQAQSDLARYYLMNEQIYVPNTEIIDWFERSAKQGNTEAWYQLGVAYSEWLPVDRRDFQYAKNAFERAAEQDHELALVELGDMYLGGVGTRKNVSLARTYYSKAAQMGNALAINRLSTNFPTATTGTVEPEISSRQESLSTRGLSTGASREALTAQEIYSRLSSKVHIVKAYRSGDEGVSTGTGFVFSEYLITNHHVVEGADEFQSSVMKWVDAEASDVIRWKLVYSDKNRDLALLTTREPDAWKSLDRFKFIPKDDRLEVGQPVFAIGAPSNFDKTITTGIVSGKRDQLELVSMAMDGALTRDQIREVLESKNEAVNPVRYIQHTATISPGSSGGPLFDQYGVIVGVNTWLVADTGINMAVSNMDLHDFIIEAHEFFRTE